MLVIEQESFPELETEIFHIVMVEGTTGAQTHHL